MSAQSNVLYQYVDEIGQTFEEVESEKESNDAGAVWVRMVVRILVKETRARAQAHHSELRV